MAKCKSCKTNIPDGTEYCKDCLDKSKTNESYLDSLLNSVKNTPQSAGNTFKKSKTAMIENSVPNSNVSQETEQEEFIPYTIDLSDIEDFDEFDLVDDLDDNIVIGDDELFGKEDSETEEELEKNNLQEQQKQMEQQELKEQQEQRVQQEQNELKELNKQNEQRNLEELKNQKELKNQMELNNQKNQIDHENHTEHEDYTYHENHTDHEDQEEQFQIDELLGQLNQVETKAKEVSINAKEQPELSQNISYELQSNDNENETENYDDEDMMDPALSDLLNELNLSGTDEEKELTDEDHLPLHDGLEHVKLDEIDDYDHMESEDDDFLSLLNQINSDDPVAADVQAINAMLNGSPVEEQAKVNMPSNVGEVFSNVLKVVSSLDDDEDENNLLEQTTAKKGKKSKKDKKNKNDLKKQSELQEESKKKDTVQIKGKKKGIINKLFSNVPEETSNKKVIVKKKPVTDESAATKEEPKKGKKKAGGKKKGTPEVTQDKDDILDNGRPGREKVVLSKKDIKKEKKEKKKKDKEIIQVINEVEEDEGRINKLGASIVLLFFALIVMIVLVGTNIFSYTLSIKNATNYFDRQKYTQAYNEVYGIDIKDEDIEIYDKIMTVMFVNKQLNSYNNNYAMKQYPLALDSLLKGLNRYDKYIELATMLGIKSDLDYVRNQILAELNNVFNLTEEEASQIISTDNQSDYSMNVYNVILEKMNN